jgi:hypothetical protein
MTGNEVLKALLIFIKIFTPFHRIPKLYQKFLRLHKPTNTRSFLLNTKITTLIYRCSKPATNLLDLPLTSRLLIETQKNRIYVMALRLAHRALILNIEPAPKKFSFLTVHIWAIFALTFFNRK